MAWMDWYQSPSRLFLLLVALFAISIAGQVSFEVQEDQIAIESIRVSSILNFDFFGRVVQLINSISILLVYFERNTT